MKQLIIDIPVQTKKDVIIDTKWLIYQEYEPAQLINGRWSIDGLRVRKTYQAVLLRLDVDTDKITGTRTDYAGFDGAPSLTVRGKDIGEISVEIRRYSDEKMYANSALSTTKPVKTLLQQQVYPILIAAVEHNKEALYEEAKSKAIKASKSYVQHYIDRAAKLEAELQEQIDSLK